MNHREGLTLIELLAALSLSVVLLAVSLGIANRFTRNQEMLKNEFPYNPLPWSIETQFNSDFQNSRAIMVDQDRSTVSMLTCRSTGRDYGTANHLPSAVVYQITSTHETSYLVRLERSLVASDQHRTNKSIVCRGVRRIMVASKLDTDSPPPSLILKVEMDDGSTFPICLTRHGGRLR